MSAIAIGTTTLAEMRPTADVAGEVIVGVTTCAGREEGFAALVDDLGALSRSGAPLRLVVHGNGVGPRTVSPLPGGAIHSRGRLGVGAARERLQHAVFEAWSEHTVAAWILDDDVRLQKLLADGGAPILADQLECLGSKGAHAGVGPTLGDAPVPSALTLRVQLEDVLDDLLGVPRSARGVTPSSSLYHDLHQPIRSLPKEVGAVGHDNLDMATHRLKAIAAGATATRRLTHSDWSFTPAQVRGGNTLILERDALIDAPNRAPVFLGREARRGDSVWLLAQRHLHHRRVVNMPLEVEHQRRPGDGSAPSPDVLRDDLLGHAAVHAMAGWLECGLASPLAHSVVPRFCARLEARRRAAEISLEAALRWLELIEDAGKRGDHEPLVIAASNLRQTTHELLEAIRPGSFDGAEDDLHRYCHQLQQRFRAPGVAAAAQ